MSRSLLLATLSLGVLALSATLTSAQTAAAPPGLVTVAGKCAPRPAMLKRLADRYAEVRQAIGMAGPEQVVEVFADIDSGSWTIIVTAANGVTCIVAAGRAYENLDESAPPGAPA